MLRRSIVSLFVLVAFLCAGFTAHAQTASNVLRTELELRRDTDFTGTLDKTQKKQLKAVNSAIAAIPSEDEALGVRIKAVAKIAKSLAKAFPLDFSTKASQNLADIFATYVMQLRGGGESAYAELVAALPGIHSAKLHAKAASARAAAREDLDLAAAAPSLFDALKILGNAVKSIDKGLALAAKDPPSETVSATLDIAPSAFDAQNVTAHFDPSFGGITVNGNSQIGGMFVSVDLDTVVSTPFVPGVYTGTAKVYVGTSPGDITTTYYTPNAMLDLRELDAATKHLKGSFSFTADTNGNPGPLMVVHATGGTIDVSKLNVP